MFERYSEPARRVIFFARYEASALGSPAIGTEHLLLGLMREGRTIAAVIFARYELTYAAVMRQLETLEADRVPTSTAVDIPLTADARQALVHATDEADRMKWPEVDTEHLLLGLLWQPDTVAGQILASAGLRLEEVREESRLRGSGGRDVESMDAFPKLAAFLHRLSRRRAAYHVSPFHDNAIRVEVGLPEEKWVVTFFPNGKVAVEVFASSGAVEEDGALERLIEKLGHE